MPFASTFLFFSFFFLGGGQSFVVFVLIRHLHCEWLLSPLVYPFHLSGVKFVSDSYCTPTSLARSYACNPGGEKKWLFCYYTFTTSVVSAVEWCVPLESEGSALSRHWDRGKTSKSSEQFSKFKLIKTTIRNVSEV